VRQKWGIWAGENGGERGESSQMKRLPISACSPGGWEKVPFEIMGRMGLGENGAQNRKKRGKQEK